MTATSPVLGKRKTLDLVSIMHEDDGRDCRAECNLAKRKHDCSCFLYRRDPKPFSQQQKIVNILENACEKDLHLFVSGLRLGLNRFNTRLEGKEPVEKEKLLRDAVYAYNNGNRDDLTLSRALSMAVFERDLVHIWLILNRCKFVEKAHERPVWQHTLRDECSEVNAMFRKCCTIPCCHKCNSTINSENKLKLN